MAYRRQSRRAPSRRARTTSRRYNGSQRRTAKRSVRGRRAAGARDRVVRIVIEQAPTSGVARPEVGGQTETPAKKGKF